MLKELAQGKDPTALTDAIMRCLSAMSDSDGSRISAMEDRVEQLERQQKNLTARMNLMQKK